MSAHQAYERVRTQKETRLVRLAQGLIVPFVDENEELLNGRKGISLAIFDLNSPTFPLDFEGSEIQVFEIGTVPPDKVADKHKLAKEKLTRLHKHDGHLSSFESQDPEADRYGGGIRVNDQLLLAASGFKPAFLDQEFCIFLALLDYQMTLTRAGEIRERTINEYPHPFRQYM